MSKFYSDEGITIDELFADLDDQTPSAHPEGEVLGYGSVGHQTLQYQAEGGNTLPVEYSIGCASSPSVINELHQLQISDQLGSAVNVENSSQPSLKRQRKQEADRKYRDNQKKQRITLERQVETLIEGCKNQKNTNAKMEKVILAQKKKLDDYERQIQAQEKKLDYNNELTAKIDELCKAKITCQICNDSDHIAPVCPKLFTLFISAIGYTGMHTSLQVPSSSNSGADNQVNPVLGGFSHLEPYNSNDNLLVGNGSANQTNICNLED